jgi:hypothetical protein
MTEPKLEKYWRNVKPSDIEEVITNKKTLMARFKDKEEQSWEVSKLIGVRTSMTGESVFYIDDLLRPSLFCQIYDPPDFFIQQLRLKQRQKPDIEVTNEPTEAQKLAERTLKAVWEATESTAEPANNPKISDSSRSKDIPTGWIKLSDYEPRLASDAYWSLGAKDWVIIGDSRVEYANRDKWSAIRLSAECAQPEPQTNTSETPNSSAATQPTNLPALKVGDVVQLSNGQIIRITVSGFEVFNAK